MEWWPRRVEPTAAETDTCARGPWAGFYPSHLRHPSTIASRSCTMTTTLRWLLAVTMIQATLTYPVARKGDTVDTYGTTKVADPYRWMEDLNSSELKRWVEAENAVTSRYLDALPQRDVLKKRITALYDYARVTMPHYEGRHWFYSRNTGLQRQNVLFTRETLTG